MTWPLVLLVCAVGVLAAAATEIVLVRFRVRWSPRRRVFTAASAGPVMIVSPLVLIVAAMALAPAGGERGLSIAALLTLGTTVGLAAFIAGLVSAFLLERMFHP